MSKAALLLIAITIITSIWPLSPTGAESIEMAHKLESHAEPPAFKRLYGDVGNQQGRKILCIGNSILYCHQAPKMLTAMIKAKKPNEKVEVEMVAGSGYSLKDHFLDGLAVRELKRRQWDIVVLQESTAQPTADTKCFLYYLNSFVKLARKQSKAVYLMETYNDAGQPAMGPTQTVLRKAAEQHHIPLIPTGEVFTYVREKYKNINIYSVDGHHPNFAGSYLLALTIYAILYHDSPRGLPATIKLPGQKEELIFFSNQTSSAKHLQDSAWIKLRSYLYSD